MHLVGGLVARALNNPGYARLAVERNGHPRNVTDLPAVAARCNVSIRNCEESEECEERSVVASCPITDAAYVVADKLADKQIDQSPAQGQARLAGVAHQHQLGGIRGQEVVLTVGVFLFGTDLCRTERKSFLSLSLQLFMIVPRRHFRKSP